MQIPRFVWVAGLFLASVALAAEPDPRQETANLLEAGAAAKEKAMNTDELEAFFQGQKKGTPLELTLDRQKNVQGLFSSYDDYYETVWMVPRGEKGFFNEKGYKLSGIRSVKPWDRKLPATVSGTAAGAVAAEASSDDYYLIKENADK